MKKLQTKFLIFLIALFISFPSIGQSWTRIYGDINYDGAVNMVIDKNYNLFTIENHMAINDGIEFCKFDSSGNLKWSWKPKYFKNGQTWGGDISISTNNDIFITGWLSDSIQIGDSLFIKSKNGSREFFISKFDFNKNFIWTLRAKSIDTLSEPTNSEGLSIEVNKKNKIYILANIEGDIILGKDSIYGKYMNDGYGDNIYGDINYLIKMDTSGVIEWNRECDCDFFKVDTSGNYYTAKLNILKKFDNDSNLLWQRIFNAPVLQIELNDWDNFYVITDSTLHKVNIITGIDEWKTHSSIELYPKISSDSSGMVLVSGMVFPPHAAPYYTGTYFEYYDKYGHNKGYFSWGNPLVYHNTTPTKIQLLNNGNIFVYGEIEVTSTFPDKSTFVFGKDTLSNIGNFDTYISKMQIDDWLLTAVISNNENANYNYFVYPNPVNDILNIENIDFYFSKSEYTLNTLLGTEIQNNVINSKTTKLDLSQLNDGIYLLRLKNNLGTSTIKIIKK